MLEIASEYMGILDHVPEVDKDLKEDQILKITVQTPALLWVSHFLTWLPWAQDLMIEDYYKCLC